MKIDRSLLTMTGAALLAGIAVAAIAYIASSALYRPATLDKPAYPIGGVEEVAPAETPAATAEAQPETAPEVAEVQPDAQPETPPEVAEAQPETQPETPPQVAEAQGQAPAASGIAALIAAADPEAGKKVSRKCAACHGFDKGGKNKVGPNLWDIVGQPVAAGEGFKYSGALKGLGGDWSYESLDGFLAAPKSFAKGTKMAFSGVKSETDRANLIAWMRSQSDNPAPLP